MVIEEVVVSPKFIWGIINLLEPLSKGVKAECQSDDTQLIPEWHLQLTTIFRSKSKK